MTTFPIRAVTDEMTPRPTQAHPIPDSQPYAIRGYLSSCFIHRTFRVSSRGDNPRPRTSPRRNTANPTIIAVSLLEGAAWREQFAEEKIKDPRILELAAKVEVRADRDLDRLYDEKWPSIVEITTEDGKTISQRIDLPKGEPEFPVSDSELKNKFMSLAGDLVSEEKAEKIWNSGMRIEELKDLSEFTELLKSGK